MAGSPDVVLAGYGVRDTLQITVETQRAVTQAGRVFTIGPPPNLCRYLDSLKVQHTDLTHLLTSGRPDVDAYLDVADVVLRTADVDPPSILLTQGNPLFLNSVSRFIAFEAGRRDLVVQVLPGVSLLDTLICDLGLDVAAFGLQLFDARRLVEREQAVNAGMPAIVLQVSALGATDSTAGGEAGPDAFAPLARHLARFYPESHAISLVNPATGSAEVMAHATAPLARFRELIPHVRTTSMLYVDAIRE